MKKTIIGIVLFLVQISLAIYFNQTIDLLIIAALSVVVFAFVIVNYKRELPVAGNKNG